MIWASMNDRLTRAKLKAIAKMFQMPKSTSLTGGTARSICASSVDFFTIVRSLRRRSMLGLLALEPISYFRVAIPSTRGKASYKMVTEDYSALGESLEKIVSRGHFKTPEYHKNS